MARRKPTIRKPTHRLVGPDGTEYAVIRCGHGSPAVRLTKTGETKRSASFALDCELLMGRWQTEIRYLFGADTDHIPEDARMVEFEEAA